MPGFKGRALIYPGLLIAGWIVGRSLSLSAATSENAPPTSRLLDRQAKSLAIASTALAPMACPSPFAQPVWQASAMPNVWRRPSVSNGGWKPRGDLAGKSGAGSLQPPYGGGMGFDLAGAASSLAISAVPQTHESRNSRTGQADTRPRKRLQIYGYSFWRQGSAAGALAPNAQYGGNQSGLVATWDAFGSAGRGPALLLRSSATPDGAQREIALGTRWQPDRYWPVSLSLERRLRAGAPDSFAAYLAGGVDRVPLTGRLAYDAYGQAGIVLDGAHGGGSSLFVDAQARLHHPLAAPLGIPLRIGTGAWIGGQTGAFRADIGPTLVADIDSPITPFTLHLDWRKRIAGNATPGDGVALTISTGF